MSTATPDQPAVPADESAAPTVAVEGGELPSMPESSIAAATQALNTALEAANIGPDDSPDAASLPEGPQEGDVDSDGKVKTVFDDATAFNVKVSSGSPLRMMCEDGSSRQTAPAPSVLALDPLVRLAANGQVAEAGKHARELLSSPDVERDSD